MFDAVTIMTIVATFLLAGSVKGITGLGLPTVSLAILTVAIDMPTAMALLLVPSFATNIWQAAAGGNGRDVLVRVWPFLLAATITVWLGVIALTKVEISTLSALLGGLLIVYGATNLAGYSLRLSGNNEKWTGPFFGCINGVLTGMTGSFVVPGVLYLQAIGLPRDALVQAMGMLFSLSTLALAIALQRNSMLSLELGAISTLALIPAMLGMVIGQKIRKNLSETKFKRVFFISLLLLGTSIVINTF
ncbi:sulfite exporter TauE/SafE family protein [Amphritea sp.]|uniref:sulfite exporter TauE/SafE family protein n=1 Tax=Amphritea sp. TaxID=1872502 RepID=UPI003D0B009F